MDCVGAVGFVKNEVRGIVHLRAEGIGLPVEISVNVTLKGTHALCTVDETATFCAMADEVWNRQKNKKSNLVLYTVFLKVILYIDFN